VLQWLLKHLPAFKPKATTDLTVFIKPLLVCLQDKQGDVRHLAEQVLVETVRTVGVDAVKRECKDLKPAVQQQLNPVLDKLKGTAKPGATLKPESAPTAAAPAPAATTTTTTTTTTSTSIPTVAPKMATSIPTIPANAAPLSQSSNLPLSARSAAATLRPATPNDDDKSSNSSSSSARSGKSMSPPKSRSPTRMKAKIDDCMRFTSPRPPFFLYLYLTYFLKINVTSILIFYAANLILLPNDQKEERSKKERKLKWAFDEPRQEFVDALKEQAALCVSTGMHVKMFAADFR
jgi:hypothetical protein